MFRDVARKKQRLSAEKIEEILISEKRGVLSVHGENGYPYGLPINFWYNKDNGYICFHSGKKGHKIESEIRNFGSATLCYELRPEHITGKTVNES